jgi:hypothetical protein
VGSTNIELCTGVFFRVVESDYLEAEEVVSVGNAGGDRDALDATVGNLLSRQLEACDYVHKSYSHQFVYTPLCCSWSDIIITPCCEVESYSWR